MPSKLILGPRMSAQSVDLGGNIFRKQVLPRDTIEYKGQKINFDEAYLQDLVRSFKDKAFDQNAFQLSDGKLEHNTNPERFRGEVLGYEVTPRGLDAIMRLTDEGAELIRKNPKLGVSPRIVENLKHGDGRVFNRAIHHIAGTLDPHNTGMGEWEEISLSTDDGEDPETIDLTGVLIEDAPVIDDEEDEEEEIDDSADEEDESEEDEEEIEDSTDDDEEDDDESEDDGDEVDDVTLTPEEMAVAEEILAALDDAENQEVKMPKAKAMARKTTSDDDRITERALELVRAENEQRDARILELEIELARSRYESEAHEFIESGVPPHLVELARPILELPAAPVIDLARTDDEGNPEVVDVGEVVRNILRESSHFFELGRELGTTVTKSDDGSTEEVLLGELRKLGGK